MKTTTLKALIPILLFCLILGVLFTPARTYISGIFWDGVSKQLQAEEKEREENAARGEIIQGRDTIMIWNNIYELGHYYDGIHLDIQTDNDAGCLLEGVWKHKVINESLYIISDEGYAVINKDNVCKILLTVPDNEYVSGYNTDEDGSIHYISRYFDDERVQYLTEFDLFSETEQRCFKELIDN